MLRNIYGDDAVDQLMQTQVENIHFFKDKLCKLEMESSGYCLGMSFDFISNYLMSINSVKPGLEIFVTRYKDGAPDKAELGHILYSAMCKYLIKKNPQLKNLNRQLAKTKKRLNYSKYKLKSFKKKRKKMTPKEQKAWTVKLTEETLKTNRKIEKLHIDGENLRLELALKKTLP
ncbi:hypothetical protein [Candidatus Rhabdochlamydia sp. T3358]|uniref:hypothetical protein n=1 Tax=Candidatus Rhabdochlamydia sp. T3358 TaxID=2099795 RepID=UPI0010B74EB1|nr:hypothetical protein [Candidatus Rhabdochlamydia sp. T3358]VHN99576.1 hypothetical protein RHT_00057 [Candidatus Rhabdochlamydia sp. T3358]